MRILLLNQSFHPDVAATAQHSFDLATHLAAAGHEVSVIASRSLYGIRGAQFERRSSTGGVSVYRVGSSWFGKAALPLRLLDFCAFWLLAAARALTLRRPDVVIALTTPPYIAALAWLVKRLRGSLFIYWAMDLYPDVPIACGVLRREGWSARVLEALNRFCLRRAERVVVLGRCMRRLILEKGIPAERISQIGVWPIEEPPEEAAATENAIRNEWLLGDSFIVMYSGNAGLGHDVETICQAMAALKSRAEIRFVFVGGGNRRVEVESFAAREELPNVSFYPYQARERLGLLLAAADLHLVSLRDAALGAMVPSKVYGVMAAGRPAIFIGPAESEAACVLTESGAGIAIRCGDAAGLSREIERLSRNRETAAEMGRIARRTLEASYSRDRSCGQWEELIAELGGRQEPAKSPSPVGTVAGLEAGLRKRKRCTSLNRIWRAIT